MSTLISRRLRGPLAALAKHHHYHHLSPRTRRLQPMSTVVEVATATINTTPVPAPAAPTVDPEHEAWARDVFRKAVAATAPRNTWTEEEISAVYHQPLMELVYQAGTLHRRFHSPGEIQLCTLMSIKTGGCAENCRYCAQSSRYASTTGLPATRLSPVEDVLSQARAAAARGSTRFCMGAAFRDLRGRKSALRSVAAMIAGVRELGMEACATLGMLDGEQAKVLKEAGLTAYNHNLDTSRKFYPEVVTSRTYDDRLATLRAVREAGIHVCTGGILGLGESHADRVSLLREVATLPSHPESFPVNALVPIPGTPMENNKPLDFPDVLRVVAAARVVMPETVVRVAAGRKGMSEEKQALCFLAGANAVFTGEKMLTTECNGWEEDERLFGRWGLVPMKSFGKSPPRPVGEGEL